MKTSPYLAWLGVPIAYIAFSFVMWNRNPGEWTIQDRTLCIACSAVITYCLFVIIVESQKKEEDQKDQEVGA